jgi:hypothetical protein
VLVGQSASGEIALDPLGVIPLGPDCATGVAQARENAQEAATISRCREQRFVFVMTVS